MSGNFQLALHLFLQLTIILLVCRIVGRLLRPMGQTQVVSEMVAGVLLGPSLLGLLAPEWQNWLFPGGAQMSILYALSQIGLVLYMFLIGLDLNRGLLMQHSRDAVMISLSGIVAPVIAGGGRWDGSSRTILPSSRKVWPRGKRRYSLLPQCPSRRSRCWHASFANPGLPRRRSGH